jgi:AraC-like DNA-binding protein
MLEKLTVPEGASWTMFSRRLEDDGIPFEWHYHADIELTLTLNTRGQRFVGDHIGSYTDGDLVLLGANLPHTWASSGKLRENEPPVVVVMWFRTEWLSALPDTLQELGRLKPLLAASSRGVMFSAETATRACAMVMQMLQMEPAQRLIKLLELLHLLSQDTSAMPLASPGAASAVVAPDERPGIEHALNHIHAHYREDIRIETLAALACRSVSRFHRLFRQHARMTVLEYVTQLRIGQACSMLVSTEQPVAHVAQAVGYNNLSHFNRKFRELKRCTPREYRGEFRQR